LSAPRGGEAPETHAVRRLGPADAALAVEALRRVKGTAADAGFGEEYLERFLAKPENVLLLADEGGAPAGFLVAYVLDRVDRDRRMICLYEIGVLPGSRRRGLARALVEALLSFGRESGVMKTWVITERGNEAAMRLYARAGGRPDAGEDVVFVWPGGG